MNCNCRVGSSTPITTTGKYNKSEVDALIAILESDCEISDMIKAKIVKYLQLVTPNKEYVLDYG